MKKRAVHPRLLSTLINIGRRSSQETNTKMHNSLTNVLTLIVSGVDDVNSQTHAEKNQETFVDVEKIPGINTQCDTQETH
jgi:hypothetical protein